MTPQALIGPQADEDDGARCLASLVSGLLPTQREDRTMNEILKGVRPMDAVLALALSAAGVLLMVENINADPNDSSLRHAITNQSWLMLPVFLLATIPVLWRRRNVLAVALFSVVAMGAHVLAFDWVVRCGAALPLSFVLAYSVGKLAPKKETYAGIAVVIVGQAVSLVKDSAVGLEILPVTAAIALAAWGVGLYVRQQTAKRADRAAVETPAGARV